MPFDISCSAAPMVPEFFPLGLGPRSQPCASSIQHLSAEVTRHPLIK